MGFDIYSILYMRGDINSMWKNSFNTYRLYGV